jgi:hypothetical protein
MGDDSKELIYGFIRCKLGCSNNWGRKKRIDLLIAKTINYSSRKYDKRTKRDKLNKRGNIECSSISVTQKSIS